MTLSWRTPVLFFVVLIGQLGLSSQYPVVKDPSAAAAAAKIVMGPTGVSCAEDHGVCYPDSITIERTMAKHKKELPPYGKIVFHAVERCAQLTGGTACESGKCKWDGDFCGIGKNDPELDEFYTGCKSGRDRSEACEQYSPALVCTTHEVARVCATDRKCQWDARHGCVPTEAYLSKIEYGEAGTPLRDEMDQAKAACERMPASSCK